MDWSVLLWIALALLLFFGCGRMLMMGMGGRRMHGRHGSVRAAYDDDRGDGTRSGSLASRPYDAATEPRSAKRPARQGHEPIGSSR